MFHGSQYGAACTWAQHSHVPACTNGHASCLTGGWRFGRSIRNDVRQQQFLLQAGGTYGAPSLSSYPCGACARDSWLDGSAACCQGFEMLQGY